MPDANILVVKAPYTNILGMTFSEVVPEKIMEVFWKQRFEGFLAGLSGKAIEAGQLAPLPKNPLKTLKLKRVG